MYDISQTIRADSVRHALQLLAEHDNAVVACGGTDVMIHIRERKLTGATLISIRDIKELSGVELLENGDIRIGAGTCFDDISRNPVILRAVPALACAAGQVGSPQIRHVATIGGNLCNGAVSADSVPALMVHNALLELTGLDGTRLVPVTGFHTGPGKTVLRKGRELLTAVIIPRSGYDGSSACYLKYGHRNAMEIATIGVAVCVKLRPSSAVPDAARSDNNIPTIADKGIAVLDAAEPHTVSTNPAVVLDDIRIAFSVAAPTPLRCLRTEEALYGKPLTAETIAALRRGVAEETSPRDSWRASGQLRAQLIKELAERAFLQAVCDAGGQCAAATPNDTATSHSISQEQLHSFRGSEDDLNQ